MTQGEMVFYAGVVLLAVTVILAIVFLIKKTRYIPGAYRGGQEETVRLRNAYPTDQLTKRYPHSHEISNSEELAKTEPMQGSAETHDTTMM